jgi:hypothetical protein
MSVQGPWGCLVVAEQNPYLWYDEISMPSSNALGASHNASASSTTQKGGREKWCRGASGEAATGGDKRFERWEEGAVTLEHHHASTRQTIH